MEDLAQVPIETVLADLENIASELEKGDLPFQMALSQYKNGLALLTQCRTYLKDAEILVKNLHEQYHQSSQS